MAKEETIAEDDDGDGHITELGYFTRSNPTRFNLQIKQTGQMDLLCLLHDQWPNVVSGFCVVLGMASVAERKRLGFPASAVDFLLFRVIDL